jgi:hypothetical protein
MNSQHRSIVLESYIDLLGTLDQHLFSMPYRNRMYLLSPGPGVLVTSLSALGDTASHAVFSRTHLHHVICASARHWSHLQ